MPFPFNKSKQSPPDYSEDEASAKMPSFKPKSKAKPEEKEKHSGSFSCPNCGCELACSKAGSSHEEADDSDLSDFGDE